MVNYCCYMFCVLQSYVCRLYSGKILLVFHYQIREQMYVALGFQYYFLDLQLHAKYGKIFHVNDDGDQSLDYRYEPLFPDDFDNQMERISNAKNLFE